jgi:hypothetical protein
VDRDRLVLGLAAVFAGLTVLLTVLAFATQPFLLAVAVPFGATTYFMWYHASGRLEEKIRDARRSGRARRAAGPAGGSARGGPAGASPFGSARRGSRANGGARTGTGAAARERSGPGRAEAYRTLGLDPGADEADVREAYRERVKEVHPDRGGDEESFRRVTRAYEALTD